MVLRPFKVHSPDGKTFYEGAETTTSTPTDDDIRRIWRDAGGRFHGPNIETGTMPESQLLPFLRSLLSPTAKDQVIAAKQQGD